MKQKRLTVRVDPHTFGGTKASENLAKILTDNYPHLVSRISVHYHKFNRFLCSCINACKYFYDGESEMLMQIYKLHQFDKIEKSNIPNVIKSHLLNVMSTSYRHKLQIVKNLKNQND